MALSDYWRTEEGLNIIKMWKRDGLTNEDIAHNMGVTRATLHNWTKKFKEIDKAVQEGKLPSDAKLENSAFKAACGYTVVEQWQEEKPDGTIVRKSVKREVPPNPTMLIFLMKNRMPDKYRDRQDVRLEGALPVIISGADDLED